MTGLYTVKCDCGNDLDVLSTTLDSDNDLLVIVESCEDCQEKARQERTDDG